MFGSTSAENMVLSNVSVFSSDELGNSTLRLNEVNLTVAPGEWLNVVGVNGSGKSTLARLLAGLYADGFTGEVSRGFVGEQASPIVLQQPEAQLFGETPREEIRFALEWRQLESASIAARTDKALAMTGLTLLADEPWERLSGGQLQLAAIAASAAAATPLMVFDEVTSMLDDANRNIVRNTAEQIHKTGTAVVWVTQRLDELRPHSRVAVLGEGRIIFDGTVRHFLYGKEGEQSPCQRSGLRLPYLTEMALELRRLNKLKDPLPMTDEEWRKVLGDIGGAERGSD